MALGLIHGLADRGIRVPEDISVVGFDDVPEAAHFLPPLTTVSQDFARIGELAVEVLLGQIAGGERAPVPAIDPVLIVRDSTARPASPRCPRPWRRSPHSRLRSRSRQNPAQVTH